MKTILTNRPANRPSSGTWGNKKWANQRQHRPYTVGVSNKQIYIAPKKLSVYCYIHVHMMFIAETPSWFLSSTAGLVSTPVSLSSLFLDSWLNRREWVWRMWQLVVSTGPLTLFV